MNHLNNFLYNNISENILQTGQPESWSVIEFGNLLHLAMWLQYASVLICQTSFQRRHLFFLKSKKISNWYRCLRHRRQHADIEFVNESDDRFCFQWAIINYQTKIGSNQNNVEHTQHMKMRSATHTGTSKHVHLKMTQTEC